jgi:hypothetical protein
VVPPYDIFREEQGGQVLWLGVAETIEEAKQRISAEMAKISCSYLIISLQSGRREVIEPPQAAKK